MLGIYIHIPFCRQACRYCDFFFSVSLKYVDEYVESLVEEIELRAGEKPRSEVETLYLGGGTPSVLSDFHLGKILDVVHKHYSFREDAEWTMECNPDDLSPAYLEQLRNKGFNRISIGIQSFFERDLELMRRSHTSIQAGQSVEDAAEAGFENITMDLIYGVPGQIPVEWEENIKKALALPVSHISAYHLTFEPGTVFDHWRKKGRLLAVHEEESVKQFQVLRRLLLERGFDHYEISNFALNGKMSAHNMLYWSGKPYLGLGPSAHSYDGTKRSWNVSSLKKYMEGVRTGSSFSEIEKLTAHEAYHDYLITSLRTRWGADPEYIEQQFGGDIYRHFEGITKSFLEKGTLWTPQGHVAIHPDHWLLTDHILRELFI